MTVFRVMIQLDLTVLVFMCQVLISCCSPISLHVISVICDIDGRTGGLNRRGDGWMLWRGSHERLGEMFVALFSRLITDSVLSDGGW